MRLAMFYKLHNMDKILSLFKCAPYFTYRGQIHTIVNHYIINNLASRDNYLLFI